MRPDGLEKLYRTHSLEDNPPGPFRPNEALIEAVSGRMVPSGRALDMSNDDGIDALFLSQSGFSVAVLGLFPGEVEVARQRAEELRARVAVYTSEPTALPFHTGEFDFVFDPRFYETLQGEERQLFVREVHRVLKPGGRFLLLVPSYKDSPRGCFTQQSVEEAFHPLFEVLRVTDTGTVDADGGLRFFYAALMARL